MPLALLGAALCLLWPLAWALSLDQPFLRRSALAAWICAVAGSLLGLTAATRDRRRRVRLLYGLDLLLLGALACSFFVLQRLPQPQATADAGRAPDFTLTAQDGGRVQLGEALVRGPVLLVFFRGRW